MYIVHHDEFPNVIFYGRDAADIGKKEHIGYQEHRHDSVTPLLMWNAILQRPPSKGPAIL